MISSTEAALVGSKLSEMVDITFLYKDLLNMANSEGKGRYQIQGWPTYADGGWGIWNM